MVPKRNQEGPRKEIEVGIEWMRGEKKNAEQKEAKGCRILELRPGRAFPFLRKRFQVFSSKEFKTWSDPEARQKERETLWSRVSLADKKRPGHQCTMYERQRYNGDTRNRRINLLLSRDWMIESESCSWPERHNVSPRHFPYGFIPTLTPKCTINRLPEGFNRDPLSCRSFERSALNRPQGPQATCLDVCGINRATPGDLCSRLAGMKRAETPKSKSFRHSPCP
ncbi:hypothetical protein APICC_06022 [Apis cerana cerana]|uniref:Uncharacterized protein n=1 Tax=Apis cerana cerana TaxID=94128 RepID=A0A2A3EIR4_APICC|nr:hypothetical protein APICC_06022 [Apis cerana cerana]